MRSMVFEFDFPNSVLSSYHALCAPTQESKLCNSRLLEDMGGYVDAGDIRLYRSFLRREGISRGNREAFKRILFQPEKGDLKGIVESLMNDIQIKKLRENILEFGEAFKPHWAGLTKELNPRLLEFIRLGVDNIDAIFEETGEFTGERIGQPEFIDVRFIEGLSGSYFSKRKESGGIYVAEPISLLREDFPGMAMYALVKETAPRMIAEKYYLSAEDFVPENADEITDCLTRAIAGRVYERVFGDMVCAPKERCSEMDESIEKQMDSLPASDFKAWYEECLRLKQGGREQCS